MTSLRLLPSPQRSPNLSGQLYIDPEAIPGLLPANRASQAIRTWLKKRCSIRSSMSRDKKGPFPHWLVRASFFPHSRFIRSLFQGHVEHVRRNVAHVSAEEEEEEKRRKEEGRRRRKKGCCCFRLKCARIMDVAEVAIT